MRTLPPTPRSVNAQSLEFTRDPYAAAAGAHALVVLTEWPQFKDLDYKLLYYFMQKPAFLFDYRGILDAPALRKVGFSVVTVGQGTEQDADEWSAGRTPAPGGPGR